jgi:hypothetical protein
LRGEYESKSNEALLHNAFGEHYLQDSFAAGHLIDKSRIMQWFVEYLDRKHADLGSTSRATGEWSMIKTVAKQRGLKSNPQMLHDKIVRGKIKSVADANTELGMSVSPEILYMMWWRRAAKEKTEHTTLTVDEAAQQCPLLGFGGDKNEVSDAMQRLADAGFATVSTGFFGRTKTYTLSQSQVNALRGGGAYDASLAKRLWARGRADRTREAQEFNLAAYAAFLNNTYVQAATKFFHDKYCKQGLEVVAGNGDSLGRIYGDEAMLSAGAHKGVEYSAETSRWSREAVFRLLSGEDEGHTTEEIKLRFPAWAIDDNLGGKQLPLDKWNEALRAAGDAGLFEQARSVGARLAYKFKGGGGISGGNALDIKSVTDHEVF